MLKKVDIENFKSIRKQSIELKKLNVLVGQNGAGKSNFISLFKFIERLVDQQLSDYIFKSGGINHFLFNGFETSEYLEVHLELGHSESSQSNVYGLKLLSNGEDYRISEEYVGYWNKEEYTDPICGYFSESTRKESIIKSLNTPVADYVRSYLRDLKVYHFHDTSDNSSLKLPQALEDVYTFRSEAENLAPFLFWLKNEHYDHYFRVVESIKLVYPQFNDFELAESPTAQGKMVLRWSEKGTNNVFTVKQISDGTLRFICLATLLSTPQSSAIPGTIILDEPELGLHPFAIHVLAELIKKASLQRQIILATQSVTLINYFHPDDLLIVERKDDGETVFVRKEADSLEAWLEDYTLGELWESNLLGGRP